MKRVLFHYSGIVIAVLISLFAVFAVVAGIVHGQVDHRLVLLAGALAVLAADSALSNRSAAWQPSLPHLSPHQAVHQDRVAGPLNGLATGILIGFGASVFFQVQSFNELGDPGLAHVDASFILGFGMTFGLGYGLIKGGGSGVRYTIGVLVAALYRRALPLRLAGFCRWACDAGLLRVAGAGYQFRHRELQDWLLTQSRPPSRL